MRQTNIFSCLTGGHAQLDLSVMFQAHPEQSFGSWKFLVLRMNLVASHLQTLYSPGALFSIHADPEFFELKASGEAPARRPS